MVEWIAIQPQKVMEYLTTWMIPENILREGSCTYGHIYVHPYEPPQKTIHLDKKQTVGFWVRRTQNWGMTA